MKNELIKELHKIEDKQQAYRNGMLEGGEGFNPFDDQVEKKLKEILAAAKQEFAAEWTAEVTASRRQTWNAWAKSLSGKVDQSQIRSQENRLGWTMSDLKKAIEINN